MIESLRTVADFEALAETADLECKLAEGRDGKGAIPKDFWPSYSAMANADGGWILLGVREQQGRFTPAGVANAEVLRRDLFNALNNREKVSINLLTEADVRICKVDDKQVLAVHIPRASRRQRPVFINGQPLGNTWRRLHDGDRRCDDETVKRMLAEQVEDERDARILPHFSLADLDIDSVRVYRQMLRDEKPAHPWLELADADFLRQLGAWRRDRETNVEGLTLAGLLMFGNWPSIQEALPHYFVDYQERPEARAERRWVDRLVPDGTWSGNLFEFYRRVYRKLVTDLKVPFALQDGQRKEDTPIHEALREALVNTLVHADYSGRVSVLVVKRPDMFGFRNPGGLRLPLEQVLTGGESDCRNRLMHQMFLMIGLGERAGSGMPKIVSGWKSQHWRQPLLREKSEPEQTLLELHMLDLLPAPVLAELNERFAERFGELGELERVVLATAVIERVVNHARLAEICQHHPRDLSAVLARLEREGFLASQGQSKGKVYYLTGQAPLSPEQVFIDMDSSVHSATSLVHNGPSLVHSASSLVHSPPGDGVEGASLESSPPGRDPNGRLCVPELDAPLIDRLDLLVEAERIALHELARLPRVKRRLAPDEMAEAILALCRDCYLTVGVLGEITDRNPKALRMRHLDQLVKDGRLQRAFPANPTHEKQAYRATGKRA